MTNQETRIYKRSFKGSIGAGAGALLGNTGKSYYILEHKTASKYHKVGETMEIIVNQIEIGRDSSCQIQYDESCQTVSRRHAAIVRDGDGWKLIQLSTTNSTLLNGEEVQKEWYLRNGDEIQLSADGPRLGFIIPVGNHAAVGSIGLSRRLNLFRQQAMRPYRNALIIMSLFLIIAIVGGGLMIFRQGEQNDSLSKLITNQTVENQRLVDTLNIIGKKQLVMDSKNKDIDLEALIEACKDDVYFLKVSDVYLVRNGNKEKVFNEYRHSNGKIYKEPFSWTGTGFLLDDGRFVTARHCVQAWRFLDLEKSYDKEKLLDFASIIDSHGIGKIEAEVKVISRTGKSFTFKVEDFKYNNFYDDTEQFGAFPSGKPRSLINVPELRKKHSQIWSTDWMYVQTTEKGKLTADAALSTNLQAGTDLYVLGFPQQIGAFDNPKTIEPPYNSFKVANSRLDNTGCILHTRGVIGGNSGGPVFVLKNNNLVVIGIVSHTIASEEYGHSVPIYNIYNIEQ